jgi:hypothetical protein
VKQSPTQILSTIVTAIVLVVLGILALGQATNRIATVSLPSQPARLASPLQFAPPTAAVNSSADAMDVSVTELRNDFLAFEQVRDTLATVGRNLTAGDLAADILAHAEDVFNEAYARSGDLLGMDEALSEHLRDFESSLREGTANQAAFATLAEAYDAALAESEIVLHHATGEDMVLLLETFHDDLHAGQNHTVILRDIEALHTALMRQYEGKTGRERGFSELNEHLHDVRETLQAGEDVAEDQLEALYREMEAFFNAG